MQCEMGDEEAYEFGAEEGGERGVLRQDGLWCWTGIDAGGRVCITVIDQLLEMFADVRVAVVECTALRVGAGRWCGGVDADTGEHLRRVWAGGGRGRRRRGGEGHTQVARHGGGQVGRGGRRGVAGGVGVRGGHAACSLFLCGGGGGGEMMSNKWKSGKPPATRCNNVQSAQSPRAFIRPLHIHPSLLGFIRMPD